jgi:hypothetical protein
MERTIEVFTTDKFLEYIFENTQKAKEFSDDSENSSSFMKFILEIAKTKLITSKGKKIIYDNKDNQLYRFIGNLYLQSQFDIIEKTTDANLMDYAVSSEKRTKFIFTHNQVDDNTEYEITIPIITKSNFASRWSNLKDITSLTISKFAPPENAFTDWNDLKSFVFPCNAIVICDNYIFSDLKLIEKNLIKILSIFSPKKNTSIIYDITIVTYDLSKIEASNNQEALKYIYEKLKYLLSQHLNGINFNLTIKKTGYPNQHDRFIFTNTHVFKSGNSFNYLTPNGKIRYRNTTDLEIQPLSALVKTNNNKKTFMNYYRHHLKEIQQYVINNGQDDLCKGTRKNRLFDI